VGLRDLGGEGVGLLVDSFGEDVVDFDDGAEEGHVEALGGGHAEEALGVLGEADAAVGGAASDAVEGVVGAFCLTSHISFQKLILVAL
jgi:hypothetical protein